MKVVVEIELDMDFAGEEATEERVRQAVEKALGQHGGTITEIVTWTGQ